MAMPPCFLSEGNTYDFTLIYRRNPCLTRTSHHSLISPSRYYLRCAAEITSTENELMMSEPDISVQILSNFFQLPINSIEKHWASSLQSTPLNYPYLFFRFTYLYLVFPLDFSSAQSRRMSMIRPKELNCRQNRRMSPTRSVCPSNSKIPVGRISLRIPWAKFFSASHSSRAAQASWFDRKFPDE